MIKLLKQLWEWIKSLFCRVKLTIKLLDETPLPAPRNYPNLIDRAITRPTEKVYHIIWNPGQAHYPCQIDIMGGFIGDFQRLYYQDKRAAIAKWSKTLKRYREEGISHIKFFVWQNSPDPTNAYMFHICPYLKLGSKTYDLSKWDELWWESFRSFLKLLRKYKLKPLVCAFMNRYGDFPFQRGRNVNGVNGVFDPKALKYQARLINRMLRVEREIFGLRHKIHFEPMNEPPHDGTDSTLHIVPDWPRAIHRESDINTNVDPCNLYIDNHNEGSYAHFVGSICPKCGRQFDFIGGPIRQIQIIGHGYSIPANLDDKNFWKYPGSKWYKPSGYWLGGDGGAWKSMSKAKGHALYMPVKGGYKMIWRQGDANQTYDMYYTAFSAAFAENKNLGGHLAHFETLQTEAREWPIMEDFSAERIHWARVRMYVKAYLDALRDAA